MSLSGGRHPGELFTFIISGGIGGSDSRSFNYRNTVTAMDMPNTRILKYVCDKKPIITIQTMNVSKSVTVQLFDKPNAYRGMLQRTMQTHVANFLGCDMNISHVRLSAYLPPCSNITLLMAAIWAFYLEIKSTNTTHPHHFYKLLMACTILIQD